MPNPRLSRAMRAGLTVVLAGLLLLVPAVVAPAQTADRSFVPESLWGVKSDVELSVVREFVTNVGDRPFWKARPSGEGVRIALIDTGLAPSHPDLDGVLACGHCWKDFVDGRRQPYDDNGHGTHVAGILVGNGHLQPNPLNAYFPTGARGLAPQAELIVAKAMNRSGGGSDERVAEAIRWAMNPDGEPNTGDEPHILHLSLGVRAPTADDGQVEAGSKTVQAVREAIERGIFVVMSAGNQGEQGPAPPGNVDGVLAVGGLDAQGQLLPFSNRGQGVDIYAPGVIMSSWPADLDEDGIEDRYTGLAGTSQAAPVVTGGLALAIDANPKLMQQAGAVKVQHIEEVVRSTADRESPGARTLRVLDANALIASQDQGTSELAWPQIGVAATLALLLIGGLGRVGWRALERFVEERSDEEPAGPPAGSSPGSGTEFEPEQ